MHPALFEGRGGEGQKERKCQWMLDRKSCMGFRMVENFLTPGGL